ncbi:MAG: PQQ-binding-like beta-propeller repeat protein [Gemmataceae bacterium]|nr:PQQ-binding-like beta-propeller repeat protein [Gemmataceae bacterium]
MSARLIWSSLCVLCVLRCESLAADPAPWATYRGNPQRTGNTDNQPGPATPAVLWAIKSQDHFLAAPVPVGADRLYVSGIGGFNRPTIYMFPAVPKGPKAEPVWVKSAPYLKLATVSSPAISGNAIVFGDGMHQDAGGILHCVSVDTGKPLWQLPMPGDLIHLEGGPTIANGRVYMGTGAGGILCVELDKAVLDGKELDLSTIAKLQDEKWKSLQAAYEKDKKVNPDTALEPTEDQLLKPQPKKVWQVGTGKWHCDAPVNVVGDKVLAPTAFLDKEKVGERALYCLNAANGEQVWKKDLPLNPWGGAAVSGDTVVVGGSTIGYYYNEIKGAKGDVTALDLATGKEKWRKEVPGGVLGCVAISDGLAVCTATDGKVRAFKLADGERAWLYDVKAPIFAPPAVAGGVVYAADLQGSVHAIDLKTGTGKWAFPVAAAPGVSAPGMVYGGVTVSGGRLYVATANLDGPYARKDTCVVCLGTK